MYTIKFIKYNVKWTLPFYLSILKKILSGKPKKKGGGGGDLFKHKKALITRSISNYLILLNNLDGMILPKRFALFCLQSSNCG